MSGVKREEFASAVAAALSSVHHLYREIDRMLAGLRDMLAEPPESLMPMRGTITKVGKDQTRLIIRNEFGALFAATTNDEIDVEEEEEESEDDVDEADEEETPARRRKRPPAEIAPDQPLLAVRVAVYDPQKQGTLEPQIQYAVMSEWAAGKNGPAPGERFTLARYMLRRVPRSLSSVQAKGARIVTRARVKGVLGKAKDDRRLSCRLPEGVESVPLYSLENAQALEDLVRKMKAMWSRAGKSKTASAATRR
jgi:hypothetical protein